MARSIDKLESLKSELESQYDISVLIYKLDVSDSNSVAEIFQELKNNKIEINLCLNNAGLAL